MFSGSTPDSLQSGLTFKSSAMPCGLTRARHDGKEKDIGHMLQEDDGKQEKKKNGK